MCYSASSSFSIFSISLFGIYLLVKRNYSYDRWLALLCFFVATVQLGEFLIWMNLPNKKNNALATKLIYISLLFQPLVMIVGALYFGDRFKISSTILHCLAGIYTLLFGYQIFKVVESPNRGIRSGPSKISPGHLVWDLSFIKSSKLIMLLYFTAPLIFLTIIPSLYGQILTSVYYILFLVIYLKYHSTKQWRSLWCLLGNIFPWLVLFAGHKLLKR